MGWVFEYALVDRTGQHDLAELRSLQDWFLKYELQTVPGVAEVATIGGMVRQYQVVVDPDKLRAFGIPLSKLKMAIQQGNQETGGSVIEMGEAEYMVRASGYLENLDDLRDIPLGVNEQGTPLVLADVADIRLGPQMRRGIAELDGEGEVVGGVIVMRWGENALQTINAVKIRLAELQRSLPDGVEIVTTYDRSDLIERAVETLQGKLLEEFIVVALVCAVFLFHLRSSAVIIFSLPVGILAAFIVMHLQGINANIMSLGGIAIAIGAMVDAAIVMIENVHKHIEKEPLTDENRWRIIGDAATEVGPPLFFSLLIITLSFLPVFTLEAQEGRLFAPLAFTKTYAMAAAAGLSITLVPVLMGYFIRGKVTPEHKNPINRILVAVYQPVIHAVIRFPKGTLALAGYCPFDRPVAGNTTRFGVHAAARRRRPDVHADHLPGRVDRQGARDPAKHGQDDPRGAGSEARLWQDRTRRDRDRSGAAHDDRNRDPAKATRGVARGHDAGGLARRARSRRSDTPGLTNAWVMPIKTRIDMLATGIKTPVGIKVAGPDLKVIERIGQDLERVLANVDGTASVYSERVAGGRYVDVDIDRKRASRFGLNINDVQDVVRSAVGGMNVTQTVEGLERYPVNIRYPQRVRDSVEQLRLLPIVTPHGARIALADVADVRVVDGPPAIKSENARLNGWTYVDITGRDLGSYVAEAQQVVTDDVELPAGYSLAWSGQYEYMVRAKERLSIVGPVTLAIIVLLLYLSFRRFAEVAIIIGTLPTGPDRRALAALPARLRSLGCRGCRIYCAGGRRRRNRRHNAGVSEPGHSRARGDGEVGRSGACQGRCRAGGYRRRTASCTTDHDDGCGHHRGSAADHARRRHRLGGHATHRRTNGWWHGQCHDSDLDCHSRAVPVLACGKQRAAGYNVKVRYASRSGIKSLSIMLIISFNSSLRFFSRRMRN